MTDKKISELPEITTPATGDILPIVDIDANLTKKITASNLSTFINSSFPTETIRDTIGAMLTGNTETDITVTHDDPNDKINFVVSVSAGNLPSSIDAAKIANGNVSNAEFETLDGVTSGIQTQINTKLAKGGDTMTGVLAMGNNAITTSSTVDGRDLGTDGSKLDGIEAGATADQTASEIRTLVESATDSNVFTDSDHTKLNAIEASATADQTNAEIRTAVEAASDSNVFTDADHTKLNGIEASADVTDATNVTAAGALMDSELANVAAVKGINQALTTTSSPTFAGITGPLTGNASTASALGTARTINLGGEVTGSASFDGSSDITITGTIAANSIGINELALNDGSNGQFIQTNGSGTISFASAIGSSVINNSAVNRVTTVNANTSDFDAEPNLTFDGSTLAVTGDITVSGTVDGADVAAMSTKLSGIEASSTADQTDAEIRAAVEAATDSNVFTDADHTKLNGIEASATADQTASEIRTLVGSATDSNVFTDALLTKLNGVETSADVTDATNVNAAGAIMNSDLGTKGQIVVGDGSGDPTILSVGTDGHYLKADSSAGSGVAWASVPAGVGGATGVDFNDDVKARFGTGNDLEIYHDGSNSYIKDAGTGNLRLEGTDVRVANSGGTGDYIRCTNGGATDLLHNGSVKISTASGGVGVTGNITVSGTVDGVDIATRDGVLTSTTTTAGNALPKAGGTMTGDLDVQASITSDELIMGDNQKIKLGNAGDLEIYHDGSNSFIKDVGTGGLYLRGDTIMSLGVGSETAVRCEINSDVKLYYDDVERAKTTSSGFAVTGELTCTGNMTASANVTAYSDERLKTDIKTIDNALDKVSQMRGVTFTKDGVANSGVIAQEMEQVAPELVQDGEYKSVAYGNTVGYLIEAIKELKAEIDELKKG
nr:putative Endo-N-acetylneuraminidase [uncultured Mediterranean phage uvMED]